MKKWEKTVVITINGYYERVDCWTYLYADNNILFTIGDGVWNFVKIGQTTVTGHKVTQEWFDKQRAQCKDYGTFVLAM